MNRKRLKRICYISGGVFVLMNVVAALHAWRFTHFVPSADPSERVDGSPGALEKAAIAISGIPNPRPVDDSLPALPYQTVELQSNVRLSCWLLPAATASPKGTIILFHGHGSSRSHMLDKAYILHRAGYQLFIPDFMGSGASEGNQTTIGYKESENVKTCYDYIKQRGENKILLMGSSMGAVSILKYIHDYPAQQPAGIILESPFGTMYQTVCARFRIFKVPAFPMAGLLLFWGSIENGFWAFSHNPDTYAKSVQCPSLLLFGEQDDRVTMGEIQAIYKNLNGHKTLSTYPLAGHNNSLAVNPEEWTRDLNRFLDRIAE